MVEISVVGKRIRKRMVDLNIATVKELELSAGIPRDSVRHILAGRTISMRADKLPALAAALKMSVEELVAGTPLAGDASAVTATVATQQSPDAPVARLRIDATALGAFGTNTSAALRWVVASADNMSPTISAGDVVLVDYAINAVDGDGIYMLGQSTGKAVFKRLQVMASSGTASIANDNQRYATETGVEPSNLQVIGRVCGVYRKL